jgi:hypothetical protein
MTTGRYFTTTNLKGQRFLQAKTKRKPRTNQEAFAESIRKWRFLAKETERVGKITNAGNHCGLCELHYRTEGFDHCGNCPIRTFTGNNECHQTPYWLYRNARTKEQAVRAAKSEVLFLRAVAVMAK